MITLTWTMILQFLGGFTACCVAGGWLIKIIRAVKKPRDDIKAKIKKESDKLDEAEEDLSYLKSATALLLRSNFVILGHLMTNNNTGEMNKIYKEIQGFVIEEATQ